MVKELKDMKGIKNMKLVVKLKKPTRSRKRIRIYNMLLTLGPILGLLLI